MEIVFLETISLGDDINLDRFDELGHVTKYRAGDGEEGGKKNCHGSNGADIVLKE